MSAETLRRAAEQMRQDWDIFTTADKEFYGAVADWLDAEAAKQTPTTHLAVTFDGAPMFPIDPRALAVARAYLECCDD